MKLSEVLKFLMIPLWGGLGVLWCAKTFPNGITNPAMIIGGLAFGAPFAIGLITSCAFIDDRWG